MLRPLGSGGMATVFLCQDERLGREVAIKRLHPYSAGDDVALRFEREAKLGASLNHPGLVAVFDTVPDDEGDLIVMEYVSGESLADALKRGPLSTERALSVVSAVASALDHAHGNGVLHRDVKPANVLLRDDGVVKLADLGIATVAEQTRITKSGTVLGTAAYMAPEQLEGGAAGPRSDVYALAAVAFEMLGGRKARPGVTPLEVAHQIATEPPPDVREAWPDAPPALAAALQRGMARRPGDRHGCASELARDLQAALREPSTREPSTREPSSTTPTRTTPARTTPARTTPARTTPARGMPAPRRGEFRRWLPGVAAASLLLAAAIAVVAIGGGNPDDARRGAAMAPSGKKDAESKQAEAPKQAQAPAASPVARAEGADGATLNAAGFELMKQGRYEEAIPILERAVAAFPAGTRDLNYAYALYNLGRSLRLAGRPHEAIPLLERRLQIPNQTATVRRELTAARSSSTGP